MMTQGLLLDPLLLTEDEVLQLYKKAYSLLLSGERYMSFEGNGVKFAVKFPISVEQMLSEARYCLKQMNPEKYGHLSTAVKPYFV